MDFLKPRYVPMKSRRRIYEGKAKILYEGPEPGTLVQFFKDDATAFNKKKHDVVDGKGVLNNRISEHIFNQLNKIGIPTHFIRRLNMREQLIREVEIIPLEVVVRNIAAGSLSKRLGIEEGTLLPRSIIEFYYKNDELGDPMVSEEHITAFGWATPQEIDDIMALAIRVNDFLSGLFLGVGIQLVDFKIECGRLWEGDMMRIVVADEISPDSCRLWDIETKDKLDKDRFRRDMGGLSRPTGSRAPARHPARAGAAEGHRPGSGPVSERREGARHRHAEGRRSRPAGQGHRRRACRPRLRRRRRRAPGQGLRHRARRNRPGQGRGGAQGDVRKAPRQYGDRGLPGRADLRSGLYPDSGRVAPCLVGRVSPGLQLRSGIAVAT